jgi:hypothetical protein
MNLGTDFPELVEMDKAARTRRCCCALKRFSSVLQLSYLHINLITRLGRAHETVLLRALEGPMNVIDTASNYLAGESESLVGRVLYVCVGVCVCVGGCGCMYMYIYIDR